MSGLFGVSRQAFYQHKEIDYEHEIFKTFVIDYVRSVREHAPRLGCEKLHEMCKAHFKEHFTLGRDAFYKLLNTYRLMLRLRKRRTRTTDSEHGFRLYPNLIRHFTPMKPNELWVGDITYIPIEGGFCYLSLITDAYSRKIIGWKLADSLKYYHTQEALSMAINSAIQTLKD